MLSSTRVVLALSLLASRVTATVFNGDANVKEFSSQALSFPTGSYSIASISGNYISFTRTDAGSGVTLTGSESTVTLSMHTITSSEANEQSPKGTTGTVISEEDCGNDCKCISAQWEVETGINADINGVAYSCAIGPNPVPGRGGIHDSKQISWITPVDTSSSSIPSVVVDLAVQVSKKKTSKVVFTKASETTSKKTSKKTSEKTSKKTCDIFTECCKSTDWLCRHPEYAKKWSQCRTKLDKCPHSRLVRRSFAPRTQRAHSYHALEHRALQERATSVVAMIHEVDHASDQVAKCLAAVKTTAFGNAEGLKLLVCDPSDTKQYWTITSA